jgi:hypothetical protein
MAKSISVITKKRRRGRPVTTGKGTLIGVRLLDAPLGTLDAWIAKQREPDLTRPEAIRRLVEAGLKSSPSQKKKTRRKQSPHARILDDHGNLITDDPKRVGEYVMAVAAKEAKGE